MASITNQPNGRRMIQFIGPDGARRSVRLGKTSRRQAETVKAHIEELCAANRSGQVPTSQTRQWVESADDRIRAVLAKAGLIEPTHIVTIGDLVTHYLKRRSDLKPKTQKFLSNSTDRALSYFGSDRRAATITVAEAQDWRRWLIAEGLSEATARTYARGIKQVFRDACDRGLLEKNPFLKLPSGSIANNNDRFVTAEDMNHVLAACPNEAWRALLVLCRFAGLRCPSETHRLEWDDVDLASGTMVVYSPKTEHHPGHEFRTVPMQRIVRETLARLDQPSARPNRVLSLTQHNLHKRLARIVASAGVEPWSDPFHCLRRSCQTEWVQDFPEYAVAAWIGNSTVVARRHYLKIPADLTARAAGLNQSAAKSDAVPARNRPHGSAIQTGPERGRSR